jgi:AraC family transcriptional regulator
MQLKIVTLPAKRLAGFICKTSALEGRNFKEVPAFWREYIESGKMERLNGEAFVKDHRHYGVWCKEDPDTSGMEYLIGLEVDRDAAVKPDYEVRELRPASYMVFSSLPAEESEFTAAIQKTWARIYGDWIPQSEYEINVMAFEFELYDERAWSEKGKVCDIYIPVIPRTL